MTESESIGALAEGLVGELLAAGKTVATAESCTGGWIAKSLTDIAGSSGCFGYGVVSYSNGAKESLLGVSPAALDEHGAVSDAVVRQMAEGALNLSGADIAAAVSGIAGPEGGSEEKPVGTVWFAWATRQEDAPGIEAEKRLLRGDRDQVRTQAVVIALQGIRERIRDQSD
ncbi:MAG: CinA family protein [Woeseia sp.]